MKLVLVFIPCYLLHYPAVMAVEIRNMYCGFIGRDDLSVNINDIQYYKMTCDISVTMFWTLFFAVVAVKISG